MKVVSSESDSPRSGALSPDTSTTAQAGQRVNLFQNIILSANVEPETQPDKAETVAKLDSDKDLKETEDKKTTSTDESINTDCSVLLAQINMINPENKPKPIVQPETTLPTLDSDVDAKILDDANKLSKQSRGLTDSIITMQSQLSVDTTLESEDNLLSDAIKAKKTKEQAMSVQTKISDDSNQKMIKHHFANLSEILAQKQNSMLQIPSDSLQQQPALPIEQVTNVLSALKATEVTPDAQANKAFDTLSQLGNFINNHTTNHFTQIGQTMVIGQASMQSDYAENLKKAMQPTHEATIELVPQSIEAIAKELYEAKIKIYPPELGHVIAKLKMDKNNAEISIMTESTKVKEIVEANLSQLRDSFLKSDINLISIHIESSQTGEKDLGGNNRQTNNQTLSSDEYAKEQDNLVSSSKESSQVLNSIIDTYA